MAAWFASQIVLGYGSPEAFAAALSVGKTFSVAIALAALATIAIADLASCLMSRWRTTTATSPTPTAYATTIRTIREGNGCWTIVGGIARTVGMGDYCVANDRIEILTVSAPPETLGKLEPKKRAVDGAEGWRLNAAAADSAWVAEVREAFRRSLIFPTDYLLTVYVDCCYPRPKSHYDRKGRLRIDAPLELDGGPRLDAVARAVFEALDRVVWKSRDQLVRFQVIKHYIDKGNEPSTMISIEKRHPPERNVRRGRK